MNRFSPSGRIMSVRMPPVAEIMNRISQLRSQGRRIYSMAQAVPWYTPPENSLMMLKKNMNNRLLHGYSPDPGFLSSRKALAEDFHMRRDIQLDPLSELHLTCGASQAFLSALISVTSPGDRVAVLEPYYFDHVFAIQFSDLELVSLPMKENNGGWELPMELMERSMAELRVLVLVNPGNPTGMVIPDEQMKTLTRLAVESNTFLIIDETYERFVFTGDHWHPWMENKSNNVLTLGSFSKSLGMPGWRLGYLFGSPPLLEQALKVQDSVVICPPAPSQLLMEHSIRDREWMDSMAMGVRRRLEACREALGSSESLSWRESGGAFFTLASYDSGMNSQEASLYLLNEYGIGTIPGSAFGDAGEGHLRISFGCLSEDEMEPAMELLLQVSFPD